MTAFGHIEVANYVHSGVSAKCFGNQAGIVFILAISTIIEWELSESQSCFLQVLKHRYC